MNSLFLLQHTCFIVTVMLALILAVSRIFTKWVNIYYERSRWMLCLAMVLLSVHYFLHMRYGFRLQSDVLGEIVTIMFYAPTFFLIFGSIINMECSDKKCRRYTLLALVGYGLILGIFSIGWLVYRSLYMPIPLYIMHVIYFLYKIVFVLVPLHEIRRNRSRIEAETGSDMRSFIMYSRASYFLICAFAFIIPVTFVSQSLLFVIAPFFFFSLFVFIMGFVMLGCSMTSEREVFEEEEKNEISDESVVLKGIQEETVELLSDETVAKIQDLLDQWCDKGGFRDNALTLLVLSRRIGVNKRDLTRYFDQTQHCTFRVWLSSIRFREAQRLMCEHPEYSNETISVECGFSSRGQLYNIFRDKTGMSPKEWKDKHIS